MVAMQTESITRGYKPEPTVLSVTAIEETLTDSYTTILQYNCSDWPGTKIVTITNTHASKDLTYSIFATNEGDTAEAYDWITLVGTGGAVAEQTVQEQTSDYQTTNLAWRQLRVQVKNTAAGQASSAKIILRSTVATA